MSETFLYLTTTGHKSGRPHRIEIWFVEIGSRYYVISEQYNVSHWVKNIRANPQVRFSISTRDQPETTQALVEGRATFIPPEEQPDLAAQVRAADAEQRVAGARAALDELQPTLDALRSERAALVAAVDELEARRQARLAEPMPEPSVPVEGEEP